jgi:hypothetical protein
VKAKLIIALAALLAGGVLHAQDSFAPRLDRKSIPTGRAPDRAADSPEKMDFGVDFSATQTPLAPRETTTPGRSSREAGRVDRPVDEPVQARFANDYAARPSADAAVQAKPAAALQPEAGQTTPGTGR